MGAPNARGVGKNCFFFDQLRSLAVKNLCLSAMTVNVDSGYWWSDIYVMQCHHQQALMVEVLFMTLTAELKAHSHHRH